MYVSERAPGIDSQVASGSHSKNLLVPVVPYKCSCRIQQSKLRGEKRLAESADGRRSIEQQSLPIGRSMAGPVPRFHSSSTAAQQQHSSNEATTREQHPATDERTRRAKGVATQAVHPAGSRTAWHRRLRSCPHPQGDHTESHGGPQEGPPSDPSHRKETVARADASLHQHR